MSNIALMTSIIILKAKYIQYIHIQKILLIFLFCEFKGKIAASSEKWTPLVATIVSYM